MTRRKSVHKHLQELCRYKKKEHCELLYKVHKKHGISKKTLFYVKEYGPHTNVTKTILKESIKILLLASLISSIGGLALEQIKETFISLIPLLILLPTLNDMIGDYAAISSSKFATMMVEGKVTRNWWTNKALQKLFVQILLIALITAAVSALLALVISSFSQYAVTTALASKVFAIVMLDVVLLVSILFFTAIVAGLHFYKKREDPNNFLIPITTSIADFGNMIILTGLVVLFF